MESTLSIVFADDGHPEDGHHGVADELLDRAAPGLDRRRSDGEIGLQDDPESLRVKQLAHGCGAHHVGEEDGDELAFLASDDYLDWRGAARAEPRILGESSAAFPADGAEIGAAFRTEPGVVPDRERADLALAHHLLKSTLADSGSRSGPDLPPCHGD